MEWIPTGIRIHNAAQHATISDVCEISLRFWRSRYLMEYDNCDDVSPDSGNKLVLSSKDNLLAQKSSLEK
jgi:hypothetical protein